MRLHRVNPHRQLTIASLLIAGSFILIVGATVVALQSLGQAKADQPLARYVPSQGLLACIEFDGLASHEKSWNATAARAVLTETSTGAMLRTLFTQLSETALSQNPNAPINGQQLTLLVEQVVRRGFVVGINQPEMGSTFPLVTFAARGGGEPAVREAFEKVVRSEIPEGAVSQVLTRQDGRKLVLVRGGETQPGWVFWFEGNDLVVVIGAEDQGAERVIAAMSDPQKSAVNHPLRQSLAQTTDGFEPVAWAWLDATALPPTPPELGLTGLNRIDFRWGFQGKELVGISHVVAPGANAKPRAGLLSLLDQETIDASNFPPIPAGTRAYTVTSFDLARAYDSLTVAAATGMPNGKEAVAGFSDAFTKQTGLQLRDDVLATLGSRWAFYIEPRSIPAPLTPFDAMGAWLTRMPPLVVLAEVKDGTKLKKALEALTRTGNPMLAATAGSAGKPIQLEPLTAPEQGLRLVVPSQVFPLPTSVDPGIIYARKYVGMSNSLDGPRHALAIAEGKGERLMPDATLLPKGLVYLEVHDPRDRMPELIANLPFFFQLLGKTGPGFPVQPPPADNPFSAISIDRELIPPPDAIRAHLFPGSTVATIDEQGLTITTRDSIPTLSLTNSLPIAVGLLLPAVQSARGRQRAQSTNNMKQIALAMHNYLSANGDRFPDDIRDADGKPLLSWRVAILPYIEQSALYQQFHLDEPWDSENNKPLLEAMPSTLAAPGGRGDAPEGFTFYQVIRGEGAMFDKENSSRIQDITDGTSNTILAVEAGNGVPWTKPDDVDYDPEKDIPRLGGMKWAGGFNAALADGSVRFLKNTINMDVLKALITRAGGEVINAEDL